MSQILQCLFVRPLGKAWLDHPCQAQGDSPTGRLPRLSGPTRRSCLPITSFIGLTGDSALEPCRPLGLGGRGLMCASRSPSRDSLGRAQTRGQTWNASQRHLLPTKLLANLQLTCGDSAR